VLAVAVAERIAVEGDPLLRRLNDQSLRWRGDPPPEGNRPGTRTNGALWRPAATTMLEEAACRMLTAVHSAGRGRTVTRAAVPASEPNGPP
jgi:hypothetical protein